MCRVPTLDTRFGPLTAHSTASSARDSMGDAVRATSIILNYQGRRSRRTTRLQALLHSGSRSPQSEVRSICT